MLIGILLLSGINRVTHTLIHINLFTYGYLPILLNFNTSDRKSLYQYIHYEDISLIKVGIYPLIRV